MKYKELKENEPLEIMEIIQYVKISNFNNKKANDDNIIEHKQVQTRIFTDGEIVKEIDEENKAIEDFNIDKHQSSASIEKTKKVYFKNHTYVITILLAEEFKKNEHINGFFDIIKDISIYLENTKDKKTLKEVKKVIKEITNHHQSINCALENDSQNKSKKLNIKKVY